MDKIINKKNKYNKILNIFYCNMSMILNHLNYLYELKILDSDLCYNFYINNCMNFGKILNFKSVLRYKSFFSQRQQRNIF